MRIWKMMLRTAACVLALAMLAAFPSVQAVRADDSAKNVLATVTATNPEDADAPVTEPTVHTAPHFKDFTYGQNILFSGIFKTNRLYFQVPSYWKVQYAYAQIEVELSQLIQDVPASLTFMVNGDPVATYRMDYRSGSTQVFYVEIPLEYLRDDYNSFDITGYVRLYDDEGCIDDFSGANWISVRSSSFVQVGYDAEDHACRICAYPYPFVSSLNEDGSETEVLVSDCSAPQELAAALLLRADLGSETNLEDRITLARLSDSTGKAKHRLVVGLRENLSDSYRSVAETAAAGESLETKAMIFFMKEGKMDTLLITSDSGDALMEAAMMLLDDSRVSQENADLAFVREHAADAIRAQSSTGLDAGRMRLDSLMDSGLSFVGPFHQTGDIYLPFSGGYVLAESGMVDLKFRYSENLDFTRSMVTVYWGDVPVCSKRLTKENAGGDTLSFTMPQDVVGSYAGKISIAFDLEIPDLFCTPRMDEMPWAYVTGDSTFYLPVGAGESYSLDQRPYPFEVSNRFNELNVVIPDHITAAELDALGRVIALYGEKPSPYGSLTVSLASALAEKEEKGGNLIVLGTYEDNSMIRELNPHLGFRFSDDGSRFLSNDSMVLSDGYAADISALQLFPSPYAGNRAVLVVGTLDDAGMENLHDFLCSSENVWKLTKDTVLVDTEQQVRAFELAEKRSSVATPILKRMMETNREATVFTLVAVGVMALLLLAVILILIRIYWRQKK